MVVPKYTYPAAASPMTPKTIRCVLGSLKFMVALPCSKSASLRRRCGSVHQRGADREFHDAYVVDLAFLGLDQHHVFEPARTLERDHEVGDDEVREGDAFHAHFAAAGLVELGQPAVVGHVDREVVHL